MDNELLFFFISILTVFLYRIVLSILLLSRKIYLIDEKFYVALLYVSIVDIIVLAARSIITGFILIALTPIVLTLFVAFCPIRVFWIINGVELSQATFYNSLRELDEKYDDLTVLSSKIRFLKKKGEKRTLLVFRNVDYNEQQLLLNKVKSICIDECKKSNKREVLSLIIYLLLVLLALLGIVLVLFL